jgi:hypothetical protein
LRRYCQRSKARGKPQGFKRPWKPRQPGKNNGFQH